MVSKWHLKLTTLGHACMQLSWHRAVLSVGLITGACKIEWGTTQEDNTNHESSNINL